MNTHAPAGIRTHNLRGRAAADLRLRTSGSWDRQSVIVLLLFFPCRYNPLWLYFPQPLAGFSLLVFGVS